MLEEKKFVLHWEDFDLNLASVFKRLRSESDFFDVTLGCSDSNGQLLQGHKVILASLSPVFKDMLKQHGSQQANNNTVLFLRGIHYRDLSAVLDFIYQGEVHIDESRLNSFLSVAEDLKIEGLTKQNQSPQVPENIQRSEQLIKKARQIDRENNLYKRENMTYRTIKIPKRSYELLDSKSENVDNRLKWESLYDNDNHLRIKDEHVRSTGLGVKSSENITLERLSNELLSGGSMCSIYDDELFDLSPSTTISLNNTQGLANKISLDEFQEEKEKSTKENFGEPIQNVEGPTDNKDFTNDEANLNKTKIDDKNVTRDFEIRKNMKGGFNIVRDGHIYLINKRNPNSIGWECLRRKIYKCRGSISSNAEMTKIHKASPHNHEPLDGKVKQKEETT